MPRCAVLGSPIAHSVSPELHRAAYAELGLTGWSYDRFEVDEAGLAGFVTGLDPTWRGLSLTKPLKAVALELGEPDHQVRLSGAANTMIFEPDGRRLLHNTDIDGLTSALRAAGVNRPDRVVILGAGGTARAILVSIAELGTREVTVLARRPEQARALQPLADAVGLQLTASDWDAPLPAAELLVSTVTAPAAATKLDGIGRVTAVFDAVYDPWPTRLARGAADRGLPVISGLELLVHQAVGQVALMTGRTISAAVLMSAGRKALSRRQTA